MPWQARALGVADLSGLIAVQRACYGDALVEGADVFARRIASAANCSLVLEQGGQVCAYLAAYRSQREKVTPLHGDFEAVAAADTLYLHDMAVLPAWAGQGLARALMERLWRIARAEGLHYSALVSVQGSEAYWARQGYAVHTLADAEQRERLSGYGEGAVYMLADLRQQP